MVLNRLSPPVRGMALLAVALSFCASAAASDPTPEPANPQPVASALKPGLSVDYYYAIFDWIDELVSVMANGEPDPGESLPNLDYRTGEGNVLSSKKTDGVGAHIRGFLHFDEPGEYSLVAFSNDGVRVALGGVRIIEDPDVHYDQYSRIVNIPVAQPGWYPLEIHYFEKRNTSTLKLLWTRPGSPVDAEMVVIPAKYYAHTK